TPLGTDPLNASYGLDVSDAFTGSLTRQLAKEVLRLNLIRTVAGDPRVAEVISVLFDDDADYIAQHPEAAASTSRQRRAALAEITVQPVAPQTSAPAGTGTLLNAGTRIDPGRLLAPGDWWKTMNNFGVTDDGFVVKGIDVILRDAFTRAQAAFGGDVDLTSTSPLRKIIEVAALEDAELWKRLEDAYYATFVSTASGDSLDLLGDDVGLPRRRSQAVGEVTLTLSNGVPGRSYLVG